MLETDIIKYNLTLLKVKIFNMDNNIKNISVFPPFRLIPKKTHLLSLAGDLSILSFIGTLTRIHEDMFELVSGNIRTVTYKSKIEEIISNIQFYNIHTII